MTAYQVTGNVREQLAVEGAVELSAEEQAAIQVVADNIDAILLVAQNLAVPGFGDLASVVAACQAAQTAAENAAASAAASSAGVASSAAAAAASASAASTSATGAAASAAAADTSGDAADVSAGAAGQSATAAAGSALLAQRYVNDPAGTEVETGKYSLLTYMAQVQGLLSAAPVLAGRLINDAGVAGVQVINLATTDLFRTIEVNRAAGHDVRFKCPNGLYTGPPPSGADRSYAWVHLIRAGVGDVYVEGPQDPGGGTTTTVFPPTMTYDDVLRQANSLTDPALNLARVNTKGPINIPTGTGRVMLVAGGWGFHADTTPGHSVVLSLTNLTGGCVGATVTQLQTVGHGTSTNAAPVLAYLWVVAIPDGAAGTLTLSWAISAMMSRQNSRAVAFQDVSGHELASLALRAGTAKTEAVTLARSVAQSTAVAFAWQADVLSNPVTFAPVGELTENGVTSFTTAKDIADAWVRDDQAAASVTYTASSAFGAPAVIGGIVLKPRTVVVTTPPGDDGLITDTTKPFKIAAQGGEAWVLAASDGTSFYAEQ
jgi:hypothetical protein